VSARLDSYISPAACAAKRRYASKATAKKVALRAQAQLGGRAMCAFRCPLCNSWHVGHPHPTTKTDADPADTGADVLIAEEGDRP